MVPGRPSPRLKSPGSLGQVPWSPAHTAAVAGLPALRSAGRKDSERTGAKELSQEPARGGCSRLRGVPGHALAGAIPVRSGRRPLAGHERVRL